jgi:hypothetical protein
VLRNVPSRFRHDSGGMILPTGTPARPLPAAIAACSPAHTWFRGFDFVFALSGRHGPYETALHFVTPSRSDISVQ